MGRSIKSGKCIDVPYRTGERISMSNTGELIILLKIGKEVDEKNNSRIGKDDIRKLCEKQEDLEEVESEATRLLLNERQ